MSPRTGPTIVLADDHAMFRSGLRALLESGFADCVVLEAPDFDSALELATATPRVAMIVVDLYMPGMNGAESIGALADAFPDTRIAVMTASEDRADVLAALDAGALGFVPKSLGADETRAALGAVLRGETYVPARLLQARRGAEKRQPASGSPVFTPRQRDVGRLLAEGMATKEIARALALGEGTVKIHLAGLYRVLGARNRAEAMLRMRDLMR